jgi:hypothetical protein
MRDRMGAAMNLFLGGLIVGAIVMVALFTIKGAVKLFVPQSLHAGIDRGFETSVEFVGRWVGRALVLFVVGAALCVYWSIRRG